MKKKIFGTILAAVLILAQTATVFAAGSKIGEAVLAGDSAGNYEMTEITEESFPELAESAPDVLTKILAVNAGEETLQSIADLAPDLEEALAGKDLLTRIFDLSPVGEGVLTDDGKYLVTLSVPTLTEEMTEVQILHYSTQRSVWELITPSEVDYTNKEITAQFEDLSPVAVIANTGSADADNAVGTSPKTGMTSSWMLWIGAAVILGAVSVIAYRKERH